MKPYFLNRCDRTRSRCWLEVDAAAQAARGAAHLHYLDECALHPLPPIRKMWMKGPRTAKVVATWLAAHPRVRVLWLPTYAGHDDNSAERILGPMKDKVAANRLAGSIEQLAGAARRFFTELPPHPAALPVGA
jgi:hypothetical protein